jgi:DNA-binding SARP family transcriptional activator
VNELRVRLLGGLVVEGVRAADVGSRKARSLLAALAVHGGRAVRVDSLAELLWGDEQPGRPHDQVGVLVSRLRGALGAERITRADSGYALAADWIDLPELELRAAAARARLQAGDGLSARLAATMALDLDRGPLLPEEDGAWLDGPRATLARTLTELRSIAAEAALRVGDPLGAVAAASEALQHDPYDEAALRNLMRGQVALGRPASALAAYAAARARLVEDLGVSPDPATEALHAAILRGDALETTGSDHQVTAEPARTGTIDGWDPLVQRARQELAATDFDAARRDADEAIRRTGGPGALEVRGWVAYYDRDLSTALRLAEEAAAGAGEDERRASSLTLAGRVRHSRGELAAAEAHLREATSCAVPGVRAVGDVWLAALRAHQGRPEEALDLVERGAVDAAAMRHPFVMPHALMARTYALGERGDVAGALEAVEAWRRTLDDLGAAGDRYRPAQANYEGWISRSIGRRDHAAARHREALASSGRFQEPRVQALLDLTALAVDAGDADEASRWLGQVEMAADDEGTMVWHQRQRSWLLGARLAMAHGDPEAAGRLAERLVVDALARGALRHQLLGRAVALQAAATLGQPVDPEDVDATLAGLDAVAGLEVWRVTAELAAATGRDDLWAAASRRAESLAAASGPAADEVRAWLDTELTRLGRP